MSDFSRGAGGTFPIQALILTPPTVVVHVPHSPYLMVNRKIELDYRRSFVLSKIALSCNVGTPHLYLLAQSWNLESKLLDSLAHDLYYPSEFMSIILSN